MKHIIFAAFMFFTITADLAPRCHMIRDAHADLAPAPDEPCYNKKEGDTCKMENSGEEGVCENQCTVRVIDEKRKYKSCSTYCVKKKEEAKSMSLYPKADAAPEPTDTPPIKQASSCSLHF